MNSIIIPKTTCTDIECPLNVDGRCNKISTMMDTLEFGLPEPDGCEIGEELVER